MKIFRYFTSIILVLGLYAGPVLAADITSGIYRPTEPDLCVDEFYRLSDIVATESGVESFNLTCGQDVEVIQCTNSVCTGNLGTTINIIGSRELRYFKDYGLVMTLNHVSQTIPSTAFESLRVQFYGAPEALPDDFWFPHESIRKTHRVYCADSRDYDLVYHYFEFTVQTERRENEPVTIARMIRSPFDRKNPQVPNSFINTAGGENITFRGYSHNQMFARIIFFLGPVQSQRFCRIAPLGPIDFSELVDAEPVGLDE